jgi:hypothetical protein
MKRGIMENNPLVILISKTMKEKLKHFWNKLQSEERRKLAQFSSVHQKHDTGPASEAA